MEKTTAKTDEQRALAGHSGSSSRQQSVSAGLALLDLPRALGNEAMGRLLGAGVVQAKLRVSQPGDADENEADAVAQRVMSRQSSGVVQRKCDCGGSCAKCQEDQEDGGVIHRSAVGGMSWVPLSIQRAEAEGGSSEGKPKRDESRHPHGHPQVVVEDETPKLETGQMRKKQFLELLQTTSCATADAALEAVGHSTKGCPYIRKWLAHYREESAAHLVSAMHKYAPETRKARSAHEAISQLNQRVERAALSWAKTGKVSGLPEGMQAEMLGAGEGGSALSKFASSGFGKGLLGFLGGKGGEGEISFGGKEKKKTSSGELQKKSRGEGAGATTEDASAVKEQLGSGHALDSRVQSQMSRAFGQDFSGVRVHTDAKAGELSTQLNARAFTIGSDVAFAGGEYQPGTPIGDALIAHELAHVVQQGGGTRSTEPQAKDANFEGNGQLEQDADRSAVSVVLKLWAGGGASPAKFGATAVPKLKSGLRLSRCSWFKSKSEDAGVKDAGVKDALSSDGGGGQIDAGEAEAPGGNMSNKKLSDADKSKIKDAFTLSSASAGVGASLKNARFVLHDTGLRPTGKGKTAADKAADLERKERARIAEHRKSGGTPVGEGPSSYVTGAGTPEIAHPHFFEADRPTATEFERGNDLMDKMSREAGMQKVWEFTDPKEQDASISTYLSRFSSLSTKDIASETAKAKTNLDSSQSTPNNDPGKPAVLTTAQGAVSVICSKIAAAGSGAGVAVKGKEKDLEAACAGLSALFTTRKERIGSSTNVEISAEQGSDCSTDRKKAIPFDPYPAADYSAVAKLYLLAALEIGLFPEITTHFFLDKDPITKKMNRCDPRCWDLGRLYSTIASILGHPSGTTYGVDFIPGTTWGTSTIWWFDPVCGAKPGAKASAPAGGAGTPPAKKPE